MGIKRVKEAKRVSKETSGQRSGRKGENKRLVQIRLVSLPFFFPSQHSEFPRYQNQPASRIDQEYTNEFLIFSCSVGLDAVCFPVLEIYFPATFKPRYWAKFWRTHRFKKHHHSCFLFPFSWLIPSPESMTWHGTREDVYCNIHHDWEEYFLSRTFLRCRLYWDAYWLLHSQGPWSLGRGTTRLNHIRAGEDYCFLVVSTRIKYSSSPYWQARCLPSSTNPYSKDKQHNTGHFFWNTLGLYRAGSIKGGERGVVNQTKKRWPFSMLFSYICFWIRSKVNCNSQRRYKIKYARCRCSYDICTFLCISKNASHPNLDLISLDIFVNI